MAPTNRISQNRNDTIRPSQRRARPPEAARRCVWSHYTASVMRCGIERGTRNPLRARHNVESRMLKCSEIELRRLEEVLHTGALLAQLGVGRLHARTTEFVDGESLHDLVPPVA